MTLCTLFLGIAASVWPEKVKPHPYWLWSIGLLGLILMVLPLLRRAKVPSAMSDGQPTSEGIAVNNTISGDNYAPQIGVVQGNLTLDQSTHTTTYGVPKPPPKILDLTVQPIAATPKPIFPIPQEQMAEFKRQAIFGEPHTTSPGLRVHFRVDAPLSNPMFRFRCDHPCLVTNIMFADHRSSNGSGVQTVPTNNPCVVIAGPKLSTLLTSNLQVQVTLRGQTDQPINLLDVEAFVL